MGEARRRGTKEQRIAQAIERERLLSMRRSEEHRQLMQRQLEERKEQARKEGIPPVLLAADSSARTRNLLIAVAAAGVFAAPATKRRI